MSAEPVTKRLRRMVAATAIGLAAVGAGIWILARALDESVPSYEGQPLFIWLQQANGPDAAASRRAGEVLTNLILPRLTDTMFHDTNDSRLRLLLVEQLNTLPGLNVYSTTADHRRADAAERIGEMGPRARASIPDLIRVINGTDPAPRPTAAMALGQIRSEPATIIPMLMKLLDDPQDGVPERAAAGLGQFGTLAKTAVPKLLDLSKTGDKDMQHAAIVALGQIAPEEASKAGN